MLLFFFFLWLRVCFFCCFFFCKLLRTDWGNISFADINVRNVWFCWSVNQCKTQWFTVLFLLEPDTSTDLSKQILSYSWPIVLCGSFPYRQICLHAAFEDFTGKTTYVWPQIKKGKGKQWGGIQTCATGFAAAPLRLPVCLRGKCKSFFVFESVETVTNSHRDW